MHATEQRRGAIDKGRRAIEGIRRDTVDPDVGMLGLERLKQAQGELLFGGILADWQAVWAAAAFGGRPAS